MSTVDFINNEHDFKVAVLGSMGFSTEYICKATGLTQCQVIYRLAKAGIRRADYRNGRSEIASTVLNAAMTQTSKLVTRRFSK